MTITLRAFTLLEVVVSTALFAAIMAIALRFYATAAYPSGVAEIRAGELARDWLRGDVRPKTHQDSVAQFTARWIPDLEVDGLYRLELKAVPTREALPIYQSTYLVLKPQLR